MVVRKHQERSYIFLLRKLLLRKSKQKGEIGRRGHRCRLGKKKNISKGGVWYAEYDRGIMVGSTSSGETKVQHNIP